jgi:hypothetical protein
MVPHDLKIFAQSRTKARSYLCYLLNRTIPNKLPNPDLKTIIQGLKILQKESSNFRTLYVLNEKGVQIGNNLTKERKLRVGDGVNRSSRAYYYRVAREKKCIMTNPYPSMLTNQLTVTAAYPIYDDKKKLHYIVCIDVTLEDLLKISQPSKLETVFENTSKIAYSLFSASLFAVAFLLFFHGVKSMLVHGFSIEDIEIKHMFQSTILLTLSLAIFDLVKTIFEEEVLGHEKGQSKDIHRTMIRFLGSIIIALSIEALMLVFKFALTNPSELINAVYLLCGISILLIGLSFYLKSTENRSNSDEDCIR